MVQSSIRTRVWRDGQLVAEDFPFEQVSDYAAEPGCLVWADLRDPDEALIAQLAEELELDRHAVEDALAERERPKAVRYPTHLFLTVYSVTGKAGDLSTGRVSAFSTEHCLVTVRLDDSVDIDSVVRRWDDDPDLVRYGPRALIHGLLDEIVDGYFDAAQSLDDAIDDLEDILFAEDARSGRRVSRTTYELRRSLVRARRAIVPMREVVATVMRGAAGEHQDDLTPYYNDLYDHVLRAVDWTNSLRDMITSVFETNMQVADTRMNTIMKKLTSWAAIIAVPTAVTGYFGQNVPYPGYQQHWGFWVSVVVMLAIAAALYVTFRVRDWL